MIVELFGCPGSGKTYTLDLISQGNGVRNKSSEIKILNIISGTIKKGLMLSPCAIKVRRSIYKEIKCHGLESRFADAASLKSQIRNISMLASVYKYLKKDLYIDEGIVHRIMTLCITYNIPKSSMLKIIANLHNTLEEVTPYFLNTPVDVCYQSIVIRNRHEAAIDELKGEQLIEVLKLYFDYSCCVSDEFNYERISREKLESEKK